MAGCTAGLVSTLSLHPLDVIKTRLQGEGMDAPAVLHSVCQEKPLCYLSNDSPAPRCSAGRHPWCCASLSRHAGCSQIECAPGRLARPVLGAGPSPAWLRCGDCCSTLSPGKGGDLQHEVKLARVEVAASTAGPSRCDHESAACTADHLGPQISARPQTVQLAESAWQGMCVADTLLCLTLGSARLGTHAR